MTKLEAVNEILEGLGEPAASALDTGGTSIEGEAEDFLDRYNRRIQHQGWAWNEEDEITLTLPDTSIAHGSVTGTFEYGETITGGTSSATGTFYYTLSGTMYMVAVSGTFQSGETLTGGTSSATASSTAAPSTITEARHAVDTTNWLSVEEHKDELVKFVQRGGYLYDTDDNTFTFDDDVKINRVKLLDFTDLTDALADYIVKAAAYNFQRFKRADQGDDQFLIQELTKAKVRAEQEDSDQRRTNILKTPGALRVKGNRNDWYLNQIIP